MFLLRARNAAILAFLLFISFFAPIKLMESRLFELRESEKLWYAASKKDEIIQEMIYFQNDLKPDNYLYSLIVQIEAEYERVSGKSDFYSQQYVNFVNNRLKKTFGIEPMFICSINGDLETKGVFLSPESGIEREKKAEFAEFINKYSLYELPDFEFFSGRQRIIDLNFENLIDTDSGEELRHTHWLERQYQKFISAYHIFFPLPNKTTRYMVDRKDFQFIYYVNRAVIRNNEFIGMITIGILEGDINLEKLIEFACSQKQRNESDLTRHYVATTASGYLAASSDESIEIKDNFPHELQTLIKNHQRLSVQSSRAFFSPGFLKVKLNSEPQDSFASMIKACEAMIRILLLFSFAMWARISLFGFGFRLSLRRKFMVLMAIVTLPPALMASIFSDLTAKKEFSLRLSFARSRLTSKLNMLEALVYEAKNRQAFHIYKLKEHLIETIKTKNIDQIDPKSFESYIKNNVESFFFYDRSGNILSFVDNLKPVDPDRFEIGNAAKYMQALGSLDRSSSRAAGHLKRQQITEGVVEGFMELLEEAKLMGLEGISAPRLVKTNPMFRNQYFLIPNTTENDKPQAFLILGTKLKQIVLRLFENIPGFVHGHLHEINSDYETELAIGERNSAEFETLHFVESLKNSDEFKKLFISIARNALSGSSFSQDADGATLKFWRSFPDTPLMFAGICRVRKKSDSELYFSLIPAAISAFALLSMLLMSEIAGNLFLPPISALGKAAEEVFRRQNLQVKVNICNHDEFDTMGSAFNAMTHGLLQKRHLSRFVSERLIATISADDSATEKLSEEIEVTILCSDLRNFTSISERIAPSEVVAILNDYFTEMESAIIANGGIIDKFAGDAVIAVFYPDSCENTAVSAGKAALAMRQKLAALNQRPGWPFPIENGIGIGTGLVISGNLGVEGLRMEFSVTGPLLKKAADLESSTRNATLSRVVVDESSYIKSNEKFTFCRFDLDEQVCYELLGENSEKESS